MAKQNKPTALAAGSEPTALAAGNSATEPTALAAGNSPSEPQALASGTEPTALASGNSPTSAPPTAEQIKLAVRVITACTGCGRIDAESRVQSMGADRVGKLAALEKAGNRTEAVRMLYNRDR
jgi:hypothetical protein